eukprot:14195905-Alexandrium_andersonii.AAC.1
MLADDLDTWAAPVRAESGVAEVWRRGAPKPEPASPVEPPALPPLSPQSADPAFPNKAFRRGQHSPGSPGNAFVRRVAKQR